MIINSYGMNPNNKNTITPSFQAIKVEAKQIVDIFGPKDSTYIMTKLKYALPEIEKYAKGSQRIIKDGKVVKPALTPCDIKIGAYHGNREERLVIIATTFKNVKTKKGIKEEISAQM